MAEDPDTIRLRYARDVMVLAERARLPFGRIEAAFASVLREDFLTPPPWQISAPGSRGAIAEDTSDPARLYRDVLVVLDAAKRLNNGQPSLHAAWMAGVDPQPGETIVQVGIGAGYYTAILAELVGERGRVEAYEIEPRLAEIACRNLDRLPQVAVHAESAVGRPLPPADVVYVSAGVAAPDLAWLDALKPGGRLVCPWQPAPYQGHTLGVTRRPGGFAARLRAHVSFVACIGAGLGDVGPVVAMPSRHVGETRSVRLTREQPPDDSATAIYRDVWFSADPV